MEFAADFKESTERLIAELQRETEALPGKHLHKDRVARERQIMELQGSPRYVDACRVVKGLEPVHGYFMNQIPTPREDVAQISSEEAAMVAARVESELRDLEPEEGPKAAPRVAPGKIGGKPEDADRLLAGWSRRLGQLEAKIKPGEKAPPKNAEDRDELEAIAQDVVWYRDRLIKNCGYRDRDLHEDTDLMDLEARLDKLADVFLREEDALPLPSLEEAAESLRKKQQIMMGKITKHLQTTAKLSPAQAKELQRLITEIAELKAELRAQGLTEHEQDKDERVLTRWVRVAELRQWEHHDKKHDRRESIEHKDLQAEVQRLREDLEEHKRRLREERGLKHQELKHDRTVVELEERFSMLCKVGGA